MEESEFYLIINLGLKSLRLIVFDDNGLEIYKSSEPVHTSMHKDFVEQDPLEWRDIFLRLIENLGNQNGLANNIYYISVTTSSSCVLGVNEENEPVTKVMMVSDKRASAEADYIKGLPEYKRLNLECSPAFALPKMLWHKNNNPKFKDVRYWLNAGDYITMLVTGAVFTDPLNASKFLADSDGEYPSELYSRLGVSAGVLPPTRPIGWQCPVGDDFKRKYNFNENCMFIQSTYDAICAVLGSGNGQAKNACDVSGTVTSVRMLADSADANCFKIPPQKIDIIDKSIIGASNNLGGGLIEWVKQAFYPETIVDDVYFLMEYDAIKSGMGAGGIIFLPYLMGERAPFSNPFIKSEFIGISRN
jgi:xylulokinase